MDINEALTAHMWDAKARGCACGWTQKESMRGMEQHNHPRHVAEALERLFPAAASQRAES